MKTTIKQTACALALIAILSESAGRAAPIFDGSTLDRTQTAAPESALPEKTHPAAQSQASASRTVNAEALPQQNMTVIPAEKISSADANMSGHKIFRDAPTADKIAASSPEIGKSPANGNSLDALARSPAFAMPKTGNVFLNAQADSARVQTSIASLLGIKLNPQHQDDAVARLEDLEKVKQVLQVAAPLPVRSLIAVEANGNLVLMSENQRFIIKGTVYDAFNNMKELKTAADIKDYAFKTDYRRLGLDPETLNSARIGTGPLTIVVYVDPLAKSTHELMTEAINMPDLENYSFYFVIMPALTDESKDAALRFYCAREAGNADAGNLLYAGELHKLQDTKCDSTVWDRTMSAAYYTGVDVVPFFVGADGAISRGIPAEGMKNWVAATVPVDYMPLRDMKLKKDLEKSITDRALQQDVLQEIENKQDADAVNPFAEVKNAANSGISPLEVNDKAYQEFNDKKLKVRAEALHKRYVRDLEKFNRAEERSRIRYEKVLERTEGALKQVRGYSDEKRQQALARLNKMKDDAFAQHQEKLQEIAQDRAQTVKDYHDELQRLQAQQAELQGE